jgi:hypothetical protein
MTQIKADISPIVVDKEAGKTSGTTTINYDKERREELWEKTNGANWLQINVHVRTGLGDEANFAGAYPITLKPGGTYEVSVFAAGHGPLSTDPILVTALKIFCLWKKPEVRNLITDQNRSTGGTWHRHQVGTSVPTNIVTIGVSRKAPQVDSNGIPHLQMPDGEPTAPLTTTNNHLVEIKPLFPGNHYFFAVVVADAFGNWDVKQEEFTCLRRKITVEFQTIHIFNDGDPSSYGEGEFWFRVHKGAFNQPKVIQDFHLPTQDIDDWSETDRPYPVGFAHVGSLEVVEPGEQNVGVSSWGIEHDGALDFDEGASSLGTFLPIPTGRFVENVSNNSLKMDCPTSTVDDDFHYGVDVRWSVEYAT